jgi:hypothetical protein
MITMGVFDLLAKDEKQSKNLDLVKKEVAKKEPKSEQKGTSQGKDQDDMKLIKALNDLEEVKKKMDESTTRILNEIHNVYADVESLGDLIREVPKQTMSELRNIKKNQPMIYDKLKQSIGESVKASVLDAIDTNILGLVKESEKINSHDLLIKAERNHVCSKNTLYIHLGRLEARGLVIKKRAGHEIMYSMVLEAQQPAVAATTAAQQ